MVGQLAELGEVDISQFSIICAPSKHMQCSLLTYIPVHIVHHRICCKCFLIAISKVVAFIVRWRCTADTGQLPRDNDNDLTSYLDRQVRGRINSRMQFALEIFAKLAVMSIPSPGLLCLYKFDPIRFYSIIPQ